MALPAGTKIGRYQIESVIGAGGMGVVYSAKDLRLRRQVALKLLPDYLAENTTALRRLEREARAIAALSDPNIVTIFDFGFHESTAYTVMELLHGQNLRRTLQQHAFSLEEATRVGLRVAEGLCAAHAKGVIHRDLKPENIFITTDARVKILDFGLAQLRQNLSEGDFGNISTATKSHHEGVVSGTLPYMSPEQLRGKRVDARSDLFSFGCVYYEMIARRSPFMRETHADTISAILHEDPFYDREISSKQAYSVIPILKSCLEKNPDQRIPDAQHLVAQLLKSTSENVAAIKKDDKPDPTPRPKRNLSIAVVVSLLVLAALGYLSKSFFFPRSQVIYSLAVLPLKNTSGNPQDDYFVDGITEEIISRLARISSIRVISRTSAMQYKQSQKSVKQIGSELGVDSVLEGSVRREGGKIRILANLIDAKSDRNIWSRSYEGAGKDILGLQNELARELSQELMTKLTPAETHRLSSSTSILPEAYDAYLRGLSHERKEDYSKESLINEITLFKQAVELEPNFALAFASLSRAHACMHHFGFEPGKDHASEAKKAADRALEIDPDLAEARLSLGYYYYWCMKDYDRALNQFGIARKALPNDISVLQGIAYIQRRQGNCESALSGLKKALLLSPRDLRIATEVGNTLSMLRRYKEADTYYDSAIGMAPDQISPYLYKIENYYLWDGKTDRAKMLFGNLPPSDGNIDYYWIRQNLYSKNYAETISRIKSTPIEIFDNQFGFNPKELLLGSVYRLMKQPVQARLHYEKAKDILESNLELKPRDPRVLSSLGIVYASLGQVDSAIEKGRLGAEVVPLEKNYVEGIFRGMDLAKIYVILGRHDDALDHLERLLAKPGFLSIRWIELDPDYEPLQQLPRFRKLTERPKSL